MTSRKPTGLAPYRQSLAGTLLAAREAVMAPIRPELRKANITEQQWRVLRVLLDQDGISAQSVASAALLYAPSVTRILKELGERGLIERRVDAEDGRRSIIVITDAGRTLVDATATHTRAILRQYDALFGVDRLDALKREIAALTQCIAHLADDD